jgi:hypothetical protein
MAFTLGEPSRGAYLDWLGELAVFEKAVTYRAGRATYGVRLTAQNEPVNIFRHDGGFPVFGREQSHRFAFMEENPRA